jgi:ubiquinone/menaquinone biosynthesis C-methylase UbiE
MIFGHVGGRMWSGSILDVGSGIGHFCKVLDMPNASYLGVEKCPMFIREGQKRFANSVRVVEGDAYNLDFESESFDLVVCNALLIHLNDAEKAFSELVRVSSRWVFITILEGDVANRVVFRDGKKIVNGMAYTYRGFSEDEMSKMADRYGAGRYERMVFEGITTCYMFDKNS